MRFKEALHPAPKAHLFGAAWGYLDDIFPRVPQNLQLALTTGTNDHFRIKAHPLRCLGLFPNILIYIFFAFTFYSSHSDRPGETWEIPIPS